MAPVAARAERVAQEREGTAVVEEVVGAAAEAVPAVARVPVRAPVVRGLFPASAFASGNGSRTARSGSCSRPIALSVLAVHPKRPERSTV